MILFVDLEASSLAQDGFPIEVAWVAEDGTGEAHLIRPTKAWLRSVQVGTAWSEASEAVHGIPLDMLLREGEPAGKVARRAFEVLGAPGARPVSDQPAYDGAWLKDLLAAARIGPVPKLGEVDGVLRESFLPLTRLLPPTDDPRRGTAVRELLDAANAILAKCANDEELTHGIQHRALADARSHWRVWRAVRERADALFDERLRAGPAPDRRRTAHGRRPGRARRRRGPRQRRHRHRAEAGLPGAGAARCPD